MNRFRYAWLVVPVLAGVLALVATPGVFAESAAVRVDRQGYVSNLPFDPHQQDTKAIYVSQGPGGELARAFVHVDLAGLPTQALLSSLTLTLRENADQSSNVNTSAATLKACTLVEEFTEPVSPSAPPGYDCKAASVEGRPGAVGSWVFELANLAQLWRVRDTGAAILPADPGSRAAWSLAFGRDLSTAAATYTTAESASAFVPGGSQPPPTAVSPLPGALLMAPPQPLEVSSPPPRSAGARPAAESLGTRAVPVHWLWLLVGIGVGALLALAAAAPRRGAAAIERTHAAPRRLANIGSSPLVQAGPAAFVIATVILLAFTSSRLQLVPGSGSPQLGPEAGTQLDDLGQAEQLNSPEASVTGGTTETPKVASKSGLTGTVQGRGVTSDNILVGASALSGNQAETFKSLGVKGGATAGDQRVQYGAMFDYFNKRGGFAGRQVKVVYYDQASEPGPSATADEQAGCQYFTEDHKVFAVFSPLTSSAALFQCYVDHQTPYIPSETGYHDQKDMDTWGMYVYTPSQINMTRMAPSYVNRLAAMNYFGHGPPVGVISFDTPAHHRAVEQVLKPALARVGQSNTRVFYFSTDTSTAANQAPNAALGFRTDGVEQVIVFGGNGGVNTLNFITTAQSQGYFPRYALTSGENPGLLLEQAVAPQSFHGAVGVGWWPINDVALERNPGPVSSAEVLCRQIMGDAGVDMSVQVTALIALEICDEVFFFERALRGSTVVSNEVLQAKAEAILNSMPTAWTFSAYIGPGRHDGVSAGRDIAYDDSCSCFRYSSALYPLP